MTALAFAALTAVIYASVFSTVFAVANLADRHRRRRTEP